MHLLDSQCLIWQLIDLSTADTSEAERGADAADPLVESSLDGCNSLVVEFSSAR